MTILVGDSLQMLKTLPDQSVQCCVTSPPYWGLRDYGHAGQIGLEDTPEAYVQKMVEVFRELRRVLRDNGTCWVNLGDSYSSGNSGQMIRDSSGGVGGGKVFNTHNKPSSKANPGRKPVKGMKPKDLVGIPWRVAFALQTDGWYLRQDIIWHKPNPMPESVTDRCTKAHEYIFLLTKSATYFYDAEAVSEAAQTAGQIGGFTSNAAIASGRKPSGNMIPERGMAYVRPATRNRRSVWTITTKPYSGAHFATFPPELPRLCILAGSKPGDTILDPFGGSGTTAMVAIELGRTPVTIELNPEYANIIRQRTNITQGLALH